MLTVAAIEKYKPQAKRRVIRDAGARSLFLIVAPSGAKSWQMRFRIGGRIGKLTVGPGDLSGKELTGKPVIGMPLSLSAARLLAAEVLRQRALGTDPVAENKVRKRQTLQIADDTFAAAAKAFILEYKNEKKKRRPRRWGEVARCLGYTLNDDNTVELIKGGLADKWANKPITEITEDNLFVVVDEAH